MVRSDVVFSVEERERLCASLVSAARADPSVTAVALTGSAATGKQDRWSDIDLALRLDASADESHVLADWTRRMYGEHDAVHHLDVWRGETRFRVFLLASTMQVDIAFWAWAKFSATGPAFRLLFGGANELPIPGPSAAAELVGTGWLHALHARSSIARGRVWQAEYMVSGLRDRTLALASLRHGLPVPHARGADDLPPDLTEVLIGTLARSLDLTELTRAFGTAVEALITEAHYADPALTDRITPVLRQLVLDLSAGLD
ncbi:MAG TPA: nucleotidyltransferase domain-containing protein [Streptosporangiaceae bacterium]|nr:nucleotidyltransferase domain-containing protein [Streptosporangiaceae bacterium]